MENLKVIEIVLKKIDIISNEQMRIIKYNGELEDRRLRLMEFIQSGPNLEITSGARNNLIKNVTEMKLNLSKSENVKDQSLQGKKKMQIQQ